MNVASGANLVSQFFEQVENKGESPFLWSKQDVQYQPITWREAAADVSTLARALKGRGVKKGDRVILVSENRPEWLIADLAIMAAGGITVPAYCTNTVDDHHHIITDSGARAAIVSTHRLAEHFLPAAQKAGDQNFVVTMEPPGIHQTLGFDILDWAAMLDEGRHEHDNIIEAAATIDPDDTACIIYTSGTGGAPKGVMLHHRAVLHNCAGALDALLELGLGDEVFLSFLPLSHSYEHMAGHFFPISIGAQIYYAEGVETLSSNMQEANPTIMTAVPRLYEMMHQRILRGVEKAGGTKEKLFRKTLELGTRRYHDPGSLSFGDKFTDFFLERLVRDKVRARFGGRLKALVSGGAPLNPDIGIFFTALGLRILQGYGQTESAPVISVNRPSNPRMDTVGPPILDTEVRIAEDGEILVRGDLVMQGYWGNEEITNEVLRDGWLHTGDIGVFDEAGHLKITDRKKDIIVNSGGDNLAPQRVEGILTLQPEITQAMVYGDRHPHLVALLVPDEEWAQQWSAENGISFDLGHLKDNKDFLSALAQAVDRVNDRLSNIEKVRHFTLADEPFSIGNGQMTPTLKIRRHVLKEIYGDALEALYG
ncbi:MAG: long-chain fatty acid--CoA ligase [Rhodospirillales bacterium]|nr:long-chain fatty acid--CoA ligase [Rhodospirillales bacterium]